MTLSQFLPDETSYPTEEINTTILKIRGKTLIFGNVIYQIHNITSIGLVDMTKTTVTPMPRLFLVLPFIGISLCFIPSELAKILGVLLVLIGIYLIYKHNRNKVKKTGKYGMTIYTNDGNRRTFRSKSEDFIKKVILVLYGVMNSDELKAISFNFETLDMSADNSIKIGTNIASSVVSGHVTGDVASQV